MRTSEYTYPEVRKSEAALALAKLWHVQGCPSFQRLEKVTVSADKKAVTVAVRRGTCTIADLIDTAVPLTQAHIKYIFWQLVYALRLLHESGVAHGKFDTAHSFVAPDCTVVVGLPETPTPDAEPAADMKSLGQVVLALLTSCVPASLPNSPVAEIVRNLTDGSLNSSECAVKLPYFHEYADIATKMTLPPYDDTEARTHPQTFLEHVVAMLKVGTCLAPLRNVVVKDIKYNGSPIVYSGLHIGSCRPCRVVRLSRDGSSSRAAWVHMYGVLQRARHFLGYDRLAWMRAIMCSPTDVALILDSAPLYAQVGVPTELHVKALTQEMLAGLAAAHQSGVCCWPSCCTPLLQRRRGGGVVDVCTGPIETATEDGMRRDLTLVADFLESATLFGKNGGELCTPEGKDLEPLALDFLASLRRGEQSAQELSRHPYLCPFADRPQSDRLPPAYVEAAEPANPESAVVELADQLREVLTRQHQLNALVGENRLVVTSSVTPDGMLVGRDSDHKREVLVRLARGEEATVDLAQDMELQMHWAKHSTGFARVIELTLSPNGSTAVSALALFAGNGTLQQKLRKAERIDLGTAERLARELLAPVLALHAVGLAHGRLQPASFIMQDGDHPQLVFDRQTPVDEHYLLKGDAGTDGITRDRYALGVMVDKLCDLASC